MTDLKRVRLTTKMDVPGPVQGTVGAVVEIPADLAQMFLDNGQAVELTDLNERDAVTPRGPQAPPEDDEDDEPDPEDD